MVRYSLVELNYITRYNSVYEYKRTNYSGCFTLRL